MLLCGQPSTTLFRGTDGLRREGLGGGRERLPHAVPGVANVTRVWQTNKCREKFSPVPRVESAPPTDCVTHTHSFRLAAAGPAPLPQRPLIVRPVAGRPVIMQVPARVRPASAHARRGCGSCTPCRMAGPAPRTVDATAAAAGPRCQDCGRARGPSRRANRPHRGPSQAW